VPTGCPGIAAQIKGLWAATPGLIPANLQVAASGCSVRISGSVATFYLRNVAAAKAAQAGATQVDVSGVSLTLVYVVQPGDTLVSIARVLYGDSNMYAAIRQANADRLPADPRNLHAGLTLVLPS
jgi:hypothetical protein